MQTTSSIDQSIQAIGIIHSPFKEKFGIPRQTGLIKSCFAEIELYAPYNNPDSVKGLDQFSDIWLIFGFHQNSHDWKPMVRPPRLGGNKKIGVFASRAPFRPNGLGLSRVELKEIITLDNKARLKISCPDIVDGTPIYDIKPYIHYADANEKACCGFAPDAPRVKLTVEFTSDAEVDLNRLDQSIYGELRQLIVEILSQDPRPAYKDASEFRRYGFKIYDLNIVWVQQKDSAIVENINKI
jgi:tRNA-Thr(GGU) m(6)t(6)A37 methyltransferase TsaA